MWREPEVEQIFTKLKNNADEKPVFTVIIPAFNEEHRIANTLREWISFLDGYLGKGYEVLVVMDGCTDSTPDIVLNFANENNRIVPIIYSKRLGKGGALRKAFEKARGDFIFFTDADGSLPTCEFLKFAEAVKACDLVIGCRRWIGSAYEASLPFHRLVLSRVFNALLHILFRELKGIHDTQCGAKALRRDILNAIRGDLFISDFAFDVNLIYSALRRGFMVVNVYVDWKHSDNASKVSGNCWKVGFIMFLSVWRLRVYYSRFRKVLNNRFFGGLFNLLYKVFS